MKRSRKLMMVLITVLIIAMIPGTAFAKKAKKAGKGGKWYVPTAGTEYTFDQDANKWEATGTTFTASFDNRGRIRSLNEVSVNTTTGAQEWVSSSTYSWRGDFVKRHTGSSSSTYSEYTYGSSFDTKYKYKGKKLTRITNSYSHSEKGRLEYTENSTTQYKYNKNDATVLYENNTVDYNEDGSSSAGNSRSTNKISLKKGKVGSAWNTYATYKYYANGNLKSATAVYNNGKDRSVQEYNQAGFPTKSTYSERVTGYDETTEKRYERTDVTVTTYNWVMNGRQPVSVEIIAVNQDGKTISHTKWEFTSIKKVKQSKNCDAFGTSVWLYPI